MEQIHFIQSRKDAQWSFLLNDGRIIEVMDKSGKLLFKYDTRRGTHLFTPCGGNPFSLRATTLEECCRDWQKTYTC